MTLDNFLAVIEAMQQTPIRELRFSGGEPFTNPYLFKMIEWANDNLDLEIGIATNGSMLNEENMERLSETRVALTIHLPSLNKKIYHKITSGNLDILIKNIPILRKIGITYSFNFVIYPQFINELQDIVNYVANYGEQLKILPYLEKNYTNYSLAFISTIQKILLQHNFSASTIDSRGIEEFVHAGSAKIRLLHSPCYSHNLARCKAYGEVRILPTMQIQNCIFGTRSYPLSLERAEDIRKTFSKAAEEMTCGGGQIAHEIPDSNFGN